MWLDTSMWSEIGLLKMFWDVLYTNPTPTNLIQSTDYSKLSRKSQIKFKFNKKLKYKI